MDLGDILKIAEKLKNVNKRALIAIAVCVALIVGIIVFDSVRSSREYQATAVAMGTVINVRLFGPDGEENSKLVIENINETEKALLFVNKAVYIKNSRLVSFNTCFACGCSAMAPQTRTQSMGVYALGLPAIAVITQTSQATENTGDDTNSASQENPVEVKTEF